MAQQMTEATPGQQVADELRLLLRGPHRAQGVNLMYARGLLGAVLPELLPMKGLPQGPPAARVGDLWDHVMAVLDLLAGDASFSLAFAALLHDVGKPRTIARMADRYTFYHHEHVGRRIASEICQRLKLAHEERERIEWLVEKHQYLADARQMRPGKLKPVLIHPGIDELLALHEADALASRHSVDHVTYCRQRRQEWTPVPP